MPKKSESKKKEKPEKTEEEKPKKLSQEEFEEKVLELGKKSLTSEKIGESLRRKNIHPKDYSKKISQILNEKKLYSNPDVQNIEKRLKRIEAHYSKNKQDKRAKREKERVFSQLRKQKKYLETQNS